jgi:hypothetical protein
MSAANDSNIADRFDAMPLLDLLAEARRMDALINNAQTDDFIEAVRAEAAYQIQKWGTVDDRGKTPADWFWLVGYLAGKALAANLAGDEHKALHHTISSGAALANWYAHIKTGASSMQPGATSDLQRAIENTFGEGAAS